MVRCFDATAAQGIAGLLVLPISAGLAGELQQLADADLAGAVLRRICAPWLLMAEQPGEALGTFSSRSLLRGCIHTQGRCGIPADAIHAVEGLSLIHLGCAEQ